MGLLALLASFYLTGRIYLLISDVRSHDSTLPADWFDHVIRSELELAAIFMVAGGLIIYHFLRRFRDAAGQ